MSEIDDLQAAVDEINAVCEKHGVVLIGTCESEGIYGEILISEARKSKVGWSKASDQLTNKVDYIDSYAESRGFYVPGIGSLNN